MAATPENIEKAAANLRAAAESGQPCDPVRELIGETDIEAAYKVQDINTQHRLDAGNRLVGRKIGLTAKAVQKQLGVDRPDYGVLFADMAVADGEDIPWDRTFQPKVEAEVALVLGQDLVHEQLTAADVIGATEYAVAAIEVVGSRVRDWNIRITDTISDNASASMFVLGNQPRRLGEFDTRMCGMVMECKGEPVSVGAGAACLGDPVNAALWLARVMVQVGRPLKAGDIVLTGALGPMAPVAPGDVLETRIEGLGSVRAAFSTE